MTVAAHGDVIHLETGRLEGKIIARADGRVTIRTTSGIETTISEKDILAIEKARTPRDIYSAMAEKIKADDAEGHYALAVWCRDHNLKDEAAAERVATLRIDPDHERARRDLGYVKTDKGWMTREAAMRAKGLMLVDGRWLTKEEIEELEKKEKNKKLVQAINAVVYQIHSGPKSERDDWENKLARFDDPAMAWKVITLLTDRSPAVRRAACASLAAMKHHDAIPHLVRRMLLDPKEPVREAAKSAVLRLDRERALEGLYDMITGVKLQKITSGSEQRAVKSLYHRIAAALGAIGDVRSVPFLIVILYPKVEIVGRNDDAGGVSGIGISRSSGGPTAVDVRERSTVIGTGTARPVPPKAEKYYFNQAAEDALKKLTGQNLGVLPKDWQEWWDEHGAERVRKAEAKRRAGRDKADKLLDEAVHEN